MVLAEKTGLCKNLDYSELRKIAKDSGKVEVFSHLVIKVTCKKRSRDFISIKMKATIF